MKNEPAYPQYDQHSISGEIINIRGGLTKREYFSAMALIGIVGSGKSAETLRDKHGRNCQSFEEAAVKLADGLIEELERTRKSDGREA